MNKQGIKIPQGLANYYQEIAKLAGLPIEAVLTVALAVGAWREIKCAGK